MSQLNNILPKELCNNIDDLVCTKIINGNVENNQFIIIFDLTEKSSKNKVIFQEWLFKCLDGIINKVFDNNDYNCSVLIDENNDNLIKIAIIFENTNLKVFGKQILESFINNPIFIEKITINCFEKCIVEKEIDNIIKSHKIIYNEYRNSIVDPIGYIIYNYWKKDKINNWSLCLHKKVLKYSFCD